MSKWKFTAKMQDGDWWMENYQEGTLRVRMRFWLNKLNGFGGFFGGEFFVFICVCVCVFAEDRPELDIYQLGDDGT